MDLVRHQFFQGDSYTINITTLMADIPTMSGFDVIANFSPHSDSGLDLNPLFVKNLTNGITAVDTPTGSSISIAIYPADTVLLNYPLLYFKVKIITSTITQTIGTGVIQFQALMGDYYLKRFRAFLRDENDLNTGEFLNTQESQDNDLMMYLDIAVQFYNDSYFQTSFTIDSFSNEFVLFVGGLLALLMSSGIISARCALSYTDLGGVVVQDMDRFGRYSQLFNQYYSYWKTSVLEMKRSWNINQSFDSIPSDMRWGGFEQNNYLPWRGPRAGGFAAGL